MKTFTAVLAVFLAAAATAAGAAEVTISANGSTGPVVAVTVGTPVTFAANVACNDELAVVPGTVQPKNGGKSSEIEWSFTNNTNSTIRLTGFGLTWNCVSDPGNVCDTWRFDYLKFGTPVTGANKIYDSACYDVNNAFPVTDFDRDVGDKAYANPWLDVDPGATIDVDEFEMVDPGGCKKINPVPAGTEVEFTVTWRDDTGKTYPQTFTVTW